MENNEYIENSLAVLNDDLSNISQWDVENKDLLLDNLKAIHDQVAIMQFKVAHKDHQILDNGHCVCEEKDEPMQEVIA